MKKLHKWLVAGVVVLLLAILGFGYFIPLGSYTSQGCTTEIAESRLHMIAGDTLEKVRKDASRAYPLEGCSKTTKYTLYFL
jgi:hypothetical protein